MAIKPVSVTQLNSYINRVMQTDPILADIAVRGEISNLTKHASGHWYFALKDAGSRINCFLPKDRVALLRYELSEGLAVTLYGSVTVYERGGYYSVNVRSVEAEGEGALQIAFENLRRRLEAEGLFDASHKRAIPAMPKRIGVATSPTGAAVRDIITTVMRRDPFTDIIIWPCLVQGPEAAASVCAAIEGLNERFPDLDLIIVGRGGGSAEDLWTFNEEMLARAVYNSRIPVISAVGHEQDIVMTDYVADLRAATPTAAGELATIDVSVLSDRVDACRPERMFGLLSGRIDMGLLRIKGLRQQCDASVRVLLAEKEHQVRLLKLTVDLHDPLSVLEKGYAVVRRQDGGWQTRAAGIKKGDRLTLIFSDGQMEVTAEGTGVH